MTRQWWLGVVCVLTLASMLQARQGTVKTKDGQTIQGDIDDNADQGSVTVTVHGIKMTLDRTTITSIVYGTSFDQEYKTRMDKLGPRDIQGRLDVGKWALDNSQYELARQAALEVQKIDPKNADAATMLRTVQSMVMLESKRGAGTTATPPGPGETETPTETVTPPASAGTLNPRYITDDQINTIRQDELQKSDTNVRVSFLHDVQARYLFGGNKDADAFNAASDVDKALTILRTGDPALIKDIKILTDPVALLDYRTKIQPRLLAGCATSGCHGGPNGGNFYLYPDASQRPAWYTNFYILQTYSKMVPDNGGFGNGPVQRGMVERTHPETSLLVQYGLLPNVATTPHPNVPNWKPLFLTDQDVIYKSTINWMGKTLKPFAPDYGFKFTLPTGASSTQPSTTQPAAAE